MRWLIAICLIVIFAMPIWAALGDVKNVDPDEVTTTACTLWPAQEQTETCGISGFGQEAYVTSDCVTPVVWIQERDILQTQRVRAGNNKPAFPESCPDVLDLTPGLLWIHNVYGPISNPPSPTRLNGPGIAPCGPSPPPFAYEAGYISHGPLNRGLDWNGGPFFMDFVTPSQAILIRSKSLRRTSVAEPGISGESFPFESCRDRFGGSFCNGVIRVIAYQTTDDSGVLQPDGVYGFETGAKDYGDITNRNRLGEWEMAFAVAGGADPITALNIDSPDGGSINPMEICIGTWSGTGDLGQEVIAAEPAVAIGGQDFPFIHNDADFDEYHTHQESGGWDIHRRPDGLYDKKCVECDAGNCTTARDAACDSCLDADIRGPALNGYYPDGKVDSVDTAFMTSCLGHTVDPLNPAPCDIADIPDISLFTFHPQGDGTVDSSDQSQVTTCAGSSWECGVGGVECGNYTGRIDTDGDNVPDEMDNCSAVAQNTGDDGFCDIDSDGYGNACDADYTNDGLHTGADASVFTARLTDGIAGNADQNCDGSDTAADAGKVVELLNQLPPLQVGPSGLACAGTAPCFP